MSGANDRTGVGNGSDEWQTPRDLFERLNDTFRFDYDPFASDANHLTTIYSTIEGSYWTTGHRMDGEAGTQDGLTFPWEGMRVFMNPPYSRGFIEKALRKAADERTRCDLIVALIPANTDTRWWHDIVGPNASHIELLRGRVRFIDPATGCPGGSPPGGSALVYYFPDWRPA